LTISYDLQDDIALITLDDGKRNVITFDMLDQMNAVFDRADAEAKAVVVAGRPDVFCAGFDINIMTGEDKDARRRLSREGGKMTLRLFSFEKPLVAACTGHCFTIGLLWVLVCDTRIGEAGDFKLAMTETALGVPFGPWSLEPLKLRLNPAHFVQAVTQSRVYTPESAVDAGFLDAVVPAGKAIGAALEIAGDLADLPAKAYATNKILPRKDVIETMLGDLS
jgi:enoyl-CoA hydratase